MRGLWSKISCEGYLKGSKKLTEVYVNIIKQGSQVLVAACDAEILGRTLRQDKLIFEVRENFYKGSKMKTEEAMILIRNATTVNLVGSKIVKHAIKEGLVHPEAILVIAGIPHAQIVKL